MIAFMGTIIVIEFIKSLLKELKREEKSSWCDPDFGPTDTDEYGAFSFTGLVSRPCCRQFQVPQPNRPEVGPPRLEKHRTRKIQRRKTMGTQETTRSMTSTRMTTMADRAEENEKWCTKGELLKEVSRRTMSNKESWAIAGFCRL